MELQKIREQLILDIENNINNWNDVISNTNPGNYGIEDWEIIVPEDGFYVDIPNKTFSFKNVDFNAKLILGSSKGESSITHDYKEIAKGKGTFGFVDSQKVGITDIEIEIDLDVFK